MTRAHRTPSPLTPPGSVQRFGRRVFDDPAHDPYRDQGKVAAGTRCPDCGARFEHGRWVWPRISSSESAHSVVCPACRRVHDRQPAGILTLQGPTVRDHAEAVLTIARHEADRVRADHPLHRVMDIIEKPGRIEITTTDVHLPRRIGEALHRAHRGELAIRYGHDEASVQVNWQG
jgi:NMD protein affecting ribosome stability and mRNA decay